MCLLLPDDAIYNSLHVGHFLSFCVVGLPFFKVTFKTKHFFEHHQNAKRSGSRSGQTFAANKERVKKRLHS